MGEKDKEMKKLMFTAALAAALVAAADGIESNNTVGYQEKEIGSFNLTLTTFAAIGADSVLGDIKPNAAFVNGGTIQTFTSAGKAGPVYIWVNDPEMLEAFEATEGWYLLEDDELTTNQGAVPVSAGEAFVAKAVGAGSTISIPSAINQ